MTRVECGLPTLAVAGLHRGLSHLCVCINCRGAGGVQMTRHPIVASLVFLLRPLEGL